MIQTAGLAEDSANDLGELGVAPVGRSDVVGNHSWEAGFLRRFLDRQGHAEGDSRADQRGGPEQPAPVKRGDVDSPRMVKPARSAGPSVKMPKRPRLIIKPKIPRSARAPGGRTRRY